MNKFINFILKMIGIKKVKQPTCLDECVDILLDEYKLDPNSWQKFKNSTEEDACSRLHFNIGRFFRNNWNLWNRKGQLTQWFLLNDVYHADDMSDIILRAFHRKLNKKSYNIVKLKERYVTHWNNCLGSNWRKILDKTFIN